MLSKHEIIDSVVGTGVLLIVRLPDADEALAVARAAVAGGIRALEITLSVPGALDVVRTLSDEYAGTGVVVGVGTVLDAQAAFASIQAGARLLVSPHLSNEVITVGNRYQAMTVAGAFTATEILTALEAGADAVKLFPAESVDPGYLRSVKAPLPQAPVIPTGGVTPDNAAAWLDAGSVALGVGSHITKAHRATGSYDAVTDASRELLAAISAHRDSRNN